MFGMPSFAWPIWGGTNIPDSFLLDVQQRYGAVPYLAYVYGDPSFGNWEPHSITKMAERGIRDVTLRLAQPKGQLRQVALMLDCYRDDIDAWLAQGIEPDLEVLNEPDVEHSEHPVEFVVDYQLQCNRLLRQRYGRKLRLLSFPLAQDVNRTPAWLAKMDPLFAGDDACDGIGWHHYVIRPADLVDGAVCSPQWLFQQKPAWFVNGQERRGLWLTEFGVLSDFNDPAAPRWSDQQRIEMLDVLVPRLIAKPWLAKMFYFVPLAEDQAYSQFFVDTDAEKATFERYCDLWREARFWPAGDLAVQTAPAGDIDSAALIGQMHAMWATYQALLSERDAHYAKQDDLAKQMFGEVVAVKRLLGVR